jgi:hypothetical protein
MQEQIKRVSSKEMHKYVLALLGVWVLFLITLPSAYMRVSQDKKFADARSHVKSMTLEGKFDYASNQLSDATSVVNNTSAQAVSISNNLQLVGLADASQQNHAIGATVANNPDIQAITNNVRGNVSGLAVVDNGNSDNSVVNTATQIAAITDKQQLRLLNQKLSDQIAQNWQPGQRLFEQKLVYRVKMSQEGAIVSYAPVNQAALKYLQETPLPNLSNSIQTNSIAKQSLIDFEVVFTPQGILEVAPWYGWNH